MYEAFQSSSREPIITRGCATESECFSSTNQMYSGTEILVCPCLYCAFTNVFLVMVILFSFSISQSNGLMPGGMQIVATCCKANSFPDDDTIAIDYSQICNSGSQVQLGLSVLFMVVTTIFMLA